MQQCLASFSAAFTCVMRSQYVVVAAALIFAVTGAEADEFRAPRGEVLLVVKGEITNTNVGNEAHFDRALLNSLGVTEIVTQSAWHEKGTLFEGVLARKVMEAVGAQGRSVTALAANDYKVSIPMADFSKYDILLATHIDGEELRLRTKGPIWMIYPESVDLPPLVRQERMIWQLTELRVD